MQWSVCLDCCSLSPDKGKLYQSGQTDHYMLGYIQKDLGKPQTTDMCAIDWLAVEEPLPATQHTVNGLS